MASHSIPTETRSQIESLLNKWGARWRLQRVVLWLPRVMMLSFVVGMIVATVVAMFQLLPMTQMLLLVGIAMGATLSLVTGAIGLWSKDGHEAARQFDNLFGLQERLATALELLDGRIQTSPEIAQRQLDDTYEIAKRVDARKQLPLHVKWLEWVGVLFLLMFLIIVLAFASYLTFNRDGGVSTQTQTAIASAADTTRDITEELATNTGLSDEERSALLESSEASLDELQNPDTNAEDSFVAMSDLEAELSNQAEAIREGVESSNESLQSALESLSGEGQASQNPGAQLAQELSELSDTLNSMSAQEQADLAESLQEAAEATETQNEALSDSLSEAAQALQDNQMQAAQDALDDASQEAQSNAQNNQSRSETADALEQSAQEAQQASRDIAETQSDDSSGENQESEDSSSNQEGQQESQDGEQQSESEGQQQAQDGQQANSEGEGQNPNANETGEDGSPVQAQEDGSAQSSSGEGEGQQGEQPLPEDGEVGQGGGSGDGESTQQTQQMSGTGDSPEADGTTNDGGEEDFESLFAPSINNVQASDSTVELETDDNDAQSIEGEFQDNPDGESTVPYNQVFSSYADSANSALENGYVPLGVRDVVRDYFTSIEPTGDE